MSATTIRPQPGRQEQFLASSADITIYGGAAGGGKTFGLLLEPLRHFANARFGAVVFRRTYPQITQEGGMWDEAEALYPLLGAQPNKNDMEWRFPSGARVKFAHMHREQNKHDWQGSQIPLLCFDQLEHFTESQFFYMLSRNRSMCGVRPYVRATVNPNAGSWVAEFVAWWIAEDGYADLERAGRVRWFIRVGSRLVWANNRLELETEYPGSRAKSVTFIPASVYDNKILLAQDPGYLANLMALPLIDRERLLGDAERGGNWKIKPEAGKVFNKAWFEIVDVAPAAGMECRFWDFAATEKELRSNDPAFTAGVKIRKAGGIFFVLDCVAFQVGPAEMERRFKNITLQDAQAAHELGIEYRVRWETEPGSAGKREDRRLTEMLAGLDAKGIRPQGDKLVRAKPLAAQSEAGNVKVLAGHWNEQWLNHMHNQPDEPHKDIMDASSGAFNDLTDWRPALRTAQVDFYTARQPEIGPLSLARTDEEIEELLNRA